jgi:alcohol dehydrogenase
VDSFGLLRPPREVIFGFGAIAAVGRIAATYGHKVLVCTDEHVASSSAFNSVMSALKHGSLDVRVFTGCQPNVPTAAVNEGVAFAAEDPPDVIVAVGGGSVIDLAKLTGALLRHPAPLSAYYGENKVPGFGVPVIAAPTTAGTGSEVTPVAVVADSSRELKVGVSSAYLVPVCAICDPAFLRTCPPTVAAHSGMDALAHAVEAFTAIRRVGESPAELSGRRVFVGKNVLSDHFALTAVRAIGLALVRAVNDPDDEARAAMLYGSLTAGLAFATAGTGLAHALQYPIGARTNTPHGLGVAVVLPQVMRFNAEARGPELTAIAQALNSGIGAADAIGAVETLNARIGIPSTLEAIGVSHDDLDRIAHEALTITRLVENNPRPASASDLRTIVEESWRGHRRSVDDA